MATCPHEGEDKGKRFVITRMSAVDADRWGRHCLQAAARIGIFAAMDPVRMDVLIDRLMQCIEMQPDPGNPATRLNWAIAQTQIGEIPTVGWLQSEAFKLHVDFFKGAGRLFSFISLMLGTEESAAVPVSET